MLVYICISVCIYYFSQCVLQDSSHFTIADPIILTCRSESVNWRQWSSSYEADVKENYTGKNARE